MKYDFETLVNRFSQGSSKYMSMLDIEPSATDCIPLSVADMELKNPPEVIEGLKQVLDTNILGCTKPTNEYYQAINKWMTTHHGFSIKPSWIQLTPGVIFALIAAVKAYVKPGEGVMIFTPSYPPFRKAILLNNATLIEIPLLKDEVNYSIDFDTFEEKASNPNNKVLILCSPHNPIGRIWTKEELDKISDICVKHNVFLISDEIHNDLILPGYNHISYGTYKDHPIYNQLMICTSVSKTFNLAGLQCSNIIIPNKEKRILFKKSLDLVGIHSLNILAYSSVIICYNQCEQWLQQLLQLIETNYNAVKEILNTKAPCIKVTPLQATYLMWIDCNSLKCDANQLEQFNQHVAKVYFDEGKMFGPQGKGFERINIAVPTKVVTKIISKWCDDLKQAGFID